MLYDLGKNVKGKKGIENIFQALSIDLIEVRV